MLIIPSYVFKVKPNFFLLKLSSLFCLKTKNLYPACKIYYGKCQCSEDYVGETNRNTATHCSKQQPNS